MDFDTYTLSPYLGAALDPERRPGVLAWLEKVLGRLDIDAIAFCGMSGALVAPAVAHELGLNLVMVRKHKAHSASRVEGSRPIKRYVIVDDLVARGTTVRRILREVEEFSPGAEPAALVLYTEREMEISVRKFAKLMPLYIRRWDGEEAYFEKGYKW